MLQKWSSGGCGERTSCCAEEDFLGMEEEGEELVEGGRSYAASTGEEGGVDSRAGAPRREGE